MGRIQRFTIWKNNERVAYAHIYILKKPEVIMTSNEEGTAVTVSLINPIKGYKYFFTIDGTEPTPSSEEFKSVTVTTPTTFKIKAYYGNSMSVPLMTKVVRVEMPKYNMFENFTLKNLDPNNLRETYINNNATSIDYSYRFYKVTESQLSGLWIDKHNYYVRTNFRYKKLKDNVENLNAVRFFTSGGFFELAYIGNDYAPDTEYKKLSAIFEKRVDTTERRKDLEFYVNDTGDGNVDKYYPEAGEVMIIDLTELEQKFPAFKAMSNNEKKEIMDTLPYFTGEFRLGGFMYNDLLKFNSTEWMQCNGYLTEPTEVQRIPSHTYYSRGLMRFKAEVTEADIADNRAIHIGFWQGHYYIMDTNEVRKFVNQNGVLASVLQIEINNYLDYYTWGIGSYPADFKFFMQGKECLCIDLTQQGWYTLFRLHGMNNEDIKEYLDSIPWFEHLYLPTI